MSNVSRNVIGKYEGIAVKVKRNCVVARPVSCAAAVGRSNVCTGMCTYCAQNVDAVFADSVGQTITTHQGRQLGVTKISLPCDWAPMFGRPEPNLTHFVRTIEEN